MSFRVERAATDLRRCAGIASVTSGVASVDGAVKCGQSPAKRTLYCAINASKLKSLGLVAVFRGQPPSPSGGKDFPALGRGRGQGWGRPKGSPQAWTPFHTKRPKPRNAQPHRGCVANSM